MIQQLPKTVAFSKEMTPPPVVLVLLQGQIAKRTNSLIHRRQTDKCIDMRKSQIHKDS
jgi:hypothetical protein